MTSDYSKNDSTLTAKEREVKGETETRFDDQDLDAAVGYASKFSDQYSEEEIYEVLQELNFSPIRCRQAITKVKETKSESRPLRNSYDQPKKNKLNDSNLNEKFISKLQYGFWTPFVAFGPILILFSFVSLRGDSSPFILTPENFFFSNIVLTIFQTLATWISVFLKVLYSVVCPLYFLLAFLAPNKLEAILKISVSIILVYIFFTFGEKLLISLIALNDFFPHPSLI